MTPIIEARDLVKRYVAGASRWGRKGQEVVALDGVDLQVRPGEVVGLVGESGCGKSTLGRCLLRLEPVDAGEIRFDGQPITDLDRKALKPFRRQAQIVFQDHDDSLDPRQRARHIVAEVLEIHGLGGDRAGRLAEAGRLLHRVGLTEAEIDRRPRQLSGGQRQRVGIARALALKPRFVVLDEPMSALDHGVQGRIMELLKGLQAELDLAYLFISHDLRLVRQMCHRVMVMVAGRVVESGETRAVLDQPDHPCTRQLLDSMPPEMPLGLPL